MSKPISMSAAARVLLPDWPCRPMMPGEWREVPLPMVKTLLRQCRMGGGEPLPDPITRMRALRVPFYRGWFAIEAQSRHSTEADGVVRILLGMQGHIPLDGTSPPIHDHNIRHLAIADDPLLVDDYLRFFTYAVRGDRGPFRIVERVEDFEPFEEIDPATIERLTETLTPLVRMDDDDGCQIREACVVYDGHLFKARFRIQPSGMIEMLDDDPLMSDVVAGSARYSGMWQIIPSAAHDAVSGLSRGEHT